VRLQRHISKVVGCTASHRNPGRVRQLVTLALLRVLLRVHEIAHIRIQEEYTYVHVSIFVCQFMYACMQFIGGYGLEAWRGVDAREV